MRDIFAEDFNRSNFVACFKMVNYQAIFKNGINARLLGKLTQYTVIMFRRNVDLYFQGRTIDGLDFCLGVFWWMDDIFVVALRILSRSEG